jgi:fatty acid desaturase
VSVERGDKKAFQRRDKHRWAQLLFILALAAAVAGGSLAAVGSLFGIVLLVVGLITMIATAWRAINQWDW